MDWLGNEQRSFCCFWCWRRRLRVPWTTRSSNQSMLQEISPEYSLEALMLKLKLPYSGPLMWRTDSSEKTLMLEKIEGGRRRGWLLGARVRNSTHGKGHEEGGFSMHKGGIEPQETPCSQASTPEARVYLLYCFMLSPTPLTLWGAVPHRFSRRRSKLAAPVNKNSWAWQGCLRSNLSAGRLACVTGLSTLLPLHTWLFTTSQP